MLEAIVASEIPTGSPSELAAWELLDDVPPAYWERWSEGAVERIRQQIRESDAAHGRGRDGGQGVSGDG